MKHFMNLDVLKFLAVRRPNTKFDFDCTIFLGYYMFKFKLMFTC